MSTFFGPLDPQGRVPPQQQTRVAAFLISAHGALARQLALALPPRFEFAWQTELNAQLYHEAEIVALLLRSTSWVADFALGALAMSWETAWCPEPADGIPDRHLALAVGLATLAHSIHAGLRPAALLPMDANANDPFVMALRRIEFESGRLLQAQILLLKGEPLAAHRDVVSAALERRHVEIRRLWANALDGIGMTLDE